MERKRDQSYWNYWEEMAKASTARNTLELPAFLGITDFEGKEVLDAGAGIGRVAFKIQGFCKKITALDSNDWALKALEESISSLGLEKKVFAKKGALEDIPFPDGSFDIVYSLWTLHHLKPDWKKKAFELNRVCKKGGTVIIAFSTEKGSIPELEALTKENEIRQRKEFLDATLAEFKSFNGNSSAKKLFLPFWFKSPEWAFEVLSNTFLPKPLPEGTEQKCIEFLKKHSNQTGCHLDEEVAFVSTEKK